ncbi:MULTISPECIES: transposase [unclassified Okeania]|uniref:transposase n=1 Tax=unclassified Okeania TaxID=2634635 RepID=UPI00257B0089|nr:MULTISPECIES: transposase [unclassified Okeania]
MSDIAAALAPPTPTPHEKMRYSSSLTDFEWVLIEPLLPKKKKTYPTKWSNREILDGILYQLKNGCNWCDLPCIFTTLFNCILALQAVASIRGDP